MEIIWAQKPFLSVDVLLLSNTLAAEVGEWRGREVSQRSLK